MDFPHKGPATRKMLSFDYVIMMTRLVRQNKIALSHDCLFFNMEIPMSGKMIFILKQGPVIRISGKIFYINFRTDIHCRTACYVSMHSHIYTYFKILGHKDVTEAIKYYSKPVNMMTSSNGNIFRVTGHLCGKFTGPRWISRTKASDAELWCFLWFTSE